MFGQSFHKSADFIFNQLLLDKRQKMLFDLKLVLTLNFNQR